MEGILFFVLIILAIWLISAFFSWIEKLIENYRAKIRDQVLNDFQKKIDVQSKIKKYQQKLEVVDYVKKEGFLKKYFKEGNIKMIREFNNFLSDCPICKKGRLIERKGKYGKFLGCSNYPNCSYTDNFKKKKSNDRTIIREKILNDIKKAYN